MKITQLNGEGVDQPGGGAGRESLFDRVPTDALERVQYLAALDDEDVDSRGYLSRVFTQVSLPYQDPLRSDPTLPAWVRKNGDLTLIVRPGVSVDAQGVPSVAYPFGKYPRLILPWVTTKIVEAERSGGFESDGSLVLEFSSSLPKFLGELGQEWGGRQGKILREQMKRLFEASFSVRYSARTEDGQGEAYGSFSVASSYNLWWDKDAGLQEGLWGNTVRITADFVKDTLAAPIPADMRALSLLVPKGALAMDIYTWMNYRLPRASSRGSLITWEQLNAQFGGQYARTRDFKAHFVKQLPAVALAYPDARFEVWDVGLLVKKSAPSAPPRGIKNR